MSALITDSDVRCLPILLPSVGKGSACPLVVPPPIADVFIAGPENRGLIDLFQPDSIAALADRSPIVLIGPNATGKTTMAATLMRLWAQETAPRRVTLSSASEFSRSLLRAIKADDMQRFRHLHRESDGLVLDNLQELAGKPTAQREFLATLDHLSALGRCVIVTASDLPLRISGLSRALQSRLSAGLSLTLQPPGPMSRPLLLEQMAKHAGLGISTEALKPLTDAWDDDPTAVELKGVLMRWAHQLRLNPSAALRSSRAVDRILDGAVAPSIPSHEIAKAVCKESGITMDQLVGPSRKSSIVRARGLAMLLIRQLNAESYENIGTLFSDRDHTTVMHACKKTESQLSSDAELNRIHDRIRQRFRRSH